MSLRDIVKMWAKGWSEKTSGKYYPVPPIKNNKTCWECGGQADYIYFTSDTKEILSVICHGCRDAIESAIKSMGKDFCTIENCEDCNEKENNS